MKKEKEQKLEKKENPEIGHSVKMPRSVKGRPVKYNFGDMQVGDHLFVEGKTSLQMWSSINNFRKKWQPKWRFGCKNNQPNPDTTKETKGVMVWRVK